MTSIARLLIMAAVSATAVIPPEPPSGRSCAGAAYQELDFLVGNWLVSDISGAVVGTSTIRKAYSDCVLIEHWRGLETSEEGLGVIGYDPEGTTWHREFLDGRGFLLVSDGRRQGRSIVMMGKDYPLDVPRVNRLTWSLRPAGTIEHSWQTSADGGETWQSQIHVILTRIAE